jgi:FAD/FMN-containing dehydrogenase
VTSQSLLDDLQGLLPPGALVVDPDVRAGYESDITGRFAGTAAAVARPQAVAQVAAVVRACAATGAPLVAQGGNTGLVGGGVPRDGEVVLSLRGLDRLGAVDLDACQVEVGAGATLAAVQEHAAAAGLELPIDLPARASATIGGMVATNAGGALALRHGSMRGRVVGLQAVLASGELVERMAGLVKDSAGYDLAQLLVGSEGTLGVVTAARLRLEPALPFRLAALFGVRDLDHGLTLLRALRTVPGLEAADVFDAACMDLVRAHRRLREPLSAAYPWYVVAQCAAAADVTAELAAAVDAIPAAPEVVAASDGAGRAELWAYREAINEAIVATGVPHKLDVGLPIAALPRFERDLRERADGGWRLYLYGHIGDGNLHVNVVGPAPDDDGVDELVLQAVARLGGTIAAEHGIGRAKRRWLHLCRTDADIEAMRAVKRALDPQGVLAPGRILPD